MRASLATKADLAELKADLVTHTTQTLVWTTGIQAALLTTILALFRFLGGRAMSLDHGFKKMLEGLKEADEGRDKTLAGLEQAWAGRLDLDRQLADLREAIQTLQGLVMEQGQTLAALRAQLGGTGTP